MNSQPKRERREQIVYCCQLVVVFTIILTALVNLTFVESDTCLWTGLISGALGYLVPNPSIRHHHHNESVLSDAAVEQLDAVLPTEHGGSVHDETEQHD